MSAHAVGHDHQSAPGVTAGLFAGRGQRAAVLILGTHQSHIRFEDRLYRQRAGGRFDSCTGRLVSHSRGRADGEAAEGRLLFLPAETVVDYNLLLRYRSAARSRTL